MNSTCQGCGKSFESDPFAFDGHVLGIPRYCGSCLERLEQAHTLELERIQAAQHARAWEEICPPLYRETDLDRLCCSPVAKAAILDWRFSSQGLLIHGPARVGKTRLVYRLLHRLHFVEGRKVAALTSTGFTHEVGIRFGEGHGRGEAFVRELARVPVLFLDDLGKGRFTDRVEAEFFHIIEARAANLRPTILTTNLTAQALRGICSTDRAEALLGRFAEFFQTVTVLP